jgi:translation initiation factor 5A
MRHHSESSGGSVASDTVPVQCSALRKGGFVMIRDRPGKVVEMATSKTGKHGHAKVHMVAIDIFTGRKMESMCPARDTVEVPVVKKRDFVLVRMDRDGFLSLLDPEDGSLREDLRSLLYSIYKGRPS